MTDNRRLDPSPFANPFADAFRFGGPFGDAFASPAPYAEMWRKMMVETPLRMTAESLRFAGRRFAAQADLVGRLASCGTVADALDLQADFVEAAIGDYSVESAKIAEEVERAEESMARTGG